MTLGEFTFVNLPTFILGSFPFFSFSILAAANAMFPKFYIPLGLECYIYCFNLLLMDYEKYLNSDNIS